MRTFFIYLIFFCIPSLSYSREIGYVNGIPITQYSVDQFVKLLIDQGAEDSEELREQVRKELINRKVFLKEANNAQLEQRIDVQNELQFARESILIKTLMIDYIKENPISEEMIKMEFDRIKAEQVERREFKIQHILLADQKMANDLLFKIRKNPKKFDKLAREMSKDLGSSENNGDLGWSVLENYVPPFAQAVEKLKKGEIASNLVETEFGWHIIRLNDIRPILFPEFEQIKPSIEEILQKRMLAAYQRDLLEAAKIEIR